MNKAIELMDGFVMQPIKGLLSLLNGHGGGANGFRDEDDIYDSMENGGASPQRQQQQRRALNAVPLEEVIRRCHRAASVVCNAQDADGELLPLEDSFLFNTFVSEAPCELGCMHRVRWIGSNHPIVLFFHYGGGTRLATPVAAHAQTPYGTLLVYAEHVVREQLHLLIECCEKLGLEVATYKRPQRPLPLSDLEAEEEEEGESPVAAESDEWAVFCGKYYNEVRCSLDPRQDTVRYTDLFYNVMYSQYQAPQLSMPVRLIWMSSSHPLMGIPRLSAAQAVRRHRTKYGVFCVYAEHQVQAAVDDLLKHLVANGHAVELRAQDDGERRGNDDGEDFVTVSIAD